MPPSLQPYIRLRSIRQNNLKGFDLDIPIGQLIVVTGLSGTGKSSLVFDTLHAEGQRRYVETFSSYTRQFLEMLDRPDVASIENIRPSIAIQQSNTVKTSRSTVGTMTELTDFFKIWFCHESDLYDPATGELVEDDSPQTIWKKTLKTFADNDVLITFKIKRPAKLSWHEIVDSLTKQGFNRILEGHEAIRIQNLDTENHESSELIVIVDRIPIQSTAKKRFIEAATTALHFGHGHMAVTAIAVGSRQPAAGRKTTARDKKKANKPEVTSQAYSEGLHAPGSDRHFKPATPALFSFNSPIGACPKCRGFGRVIEIDYRLVIPDHSLSIADGAIKPFQGEVYSESLRDLCRTARKHQIPTDIAWQDLTAAQKQFIIEGDSDYGENGKQWPKAWYGIQRFFGWLESNSYKMHVRVFLSKYRAYTQCPDCAGTRLVPDALNWKWHEYTLPQLYNLPLNELLDLLNQHARKTGDHQVDIALESILTRLNYLDQVGLSYLTLDRASRTLSGGEVERVNLTACLGTSLVDTLFILDEPSIGLHARDIDRLIHILRRLTNLGNTVVVVEHDEAIMRAADHIIELGPEPGNKGGELIFNGPARKILTCNNSLTGRYLAGKHTIPLPTTRRPVLPETKASSKPTIDYLRIQSATCHNIRNLSIDIPLQRLVCLTGVSGSGKSTLLNNVIYQGLLQYAGKFADNPASIQHLHCDRELGDIVFVDQSPVSKTPRSNAALYTDAWVTIRKLYASTSGAQEAGFTAGHFSFNSGEGRCDHCNGLGYEKVEMQFLSDVYVPCPICAGQRFKPEVLAVEWQGKSIAEILELDVNAAILFFRDQRAIVAALEPLAAVGLGYLPLGQPLNTLSGGESQRLKLIKHLTQLKPREHPHLILLDEPTTGLHRHDIKRLIGVLQQLVDLGHSLIVIEHQTDLIQAADWIIELGPEAGMRGGQVVAAGTPEAIAKNKKTATGPFLQHSSSPQRAHHPQPPARKRRALKSTQCLEIVGAREHNLKNLSLSIPHNQISVVTGVSGSGKSSLAFDIVFAEGQRRFMESMSAYARQFVEQLPRPDIDRITGIAPTVAIEQRVTRGSRKSTVATITEVAQYLRLLYAKVGIQHSPVSGRPVVAQAFSAVEKNLRTKVKALGSAHNKRAGKKSAGVALCAPLVRARKGHHEPLANWAKDKGYEMLRIDGQLTELAKFKKLDRYREHDIELVITQFRPGQTLPNNFTVLLKEALRLGKGTCFVLDIPSGSTFWYSTARTDPETGQAYPELDPKHFSWNSAKGWCPTCRGHGSLYDWMRGHEDFHHLPRRFADDTVCPDCQGGRLNPISSAVKLYCQDKQQFSLPQLLALPPAQLLAQLQQLDLDVRGRQIASGILPQIAERLQFMDHVGLGYLSLERSTATLSGGEAQRIRLAGQLSSNLSGVLYVLDEPSIGLHARDNRQLIQSLQQLRDKGNTLLVVEHNIETMRAADRIIDLGPGAGIHGGSLLANDSFKKIQKNKHSLTAKYIKQGIPHPLRGSYRPLPTRWTPRSKPRQPAWLVLQNPRLRNLKGDDLRIPLRRLIMVCGISGAGKSTLIRDLLKPAVSQALRNKSTKFTIASAKDKQRATVLHNAHTFKQVIEVDQEPIGKTPRSTPSTYIGAFDIIRQFFASLPEAKMHGYKPGHFSFNTRGGRCETCQGAGRVKLEMAFLPDSYVTCEDCGGLRYSSELYNIRWKGKNIAELLQMSFEEAANFFSFHTRLHDMMQLMVETGLGYLTLGQSSPTLSGGEAQRLKLVSELAKGLASYKEKSLNIGKHNLYILEEPTIGLHLSDCQKLIDLFHRLVEQGHTVVVIEHHLDLIAEADYVVEVGPEGGDAGGKILYQGDVPGLAKMADSPTAPFLRQGRDTV